MKFCASYQVQCWQTVLYSEIANFLNPQNVSGQAIKTYMYSPLKQPPRHAPQVLAEAVAAQDVNVVEETANQPPWACEAAYVGKETASVGRRRWDDCTRCWLYIDLVNFFEGTEPHHCRNKINNYWPYLSQTFWYFASFLRMPESLLPSTGHLYQAMWAPSGGGVLNGVL